MGAEEFEYYKDLHGGGTADDIRALAAEPAKHADLIGRLATDLRGDATRTGGYVEGSIKAATQAHPTQASSHAQTLSAAGFYAVGLINEFAGHVETFDTEVKSIRAAYRTEVAEAVTAMWHSDAVTNDEDITAAEVSAMVDRAAIVARLKRHRYNPAKATLEEGASAVARSLNNGVDPEKVLTMIRAGLIPLSAVPVFPDVHLTEHDINTALKNLIKDIGSSEFLNIFGAHDGFPLVPLILGMGKVTRMARGIPPIFQTGIVGKNLLAFLKTTGGNVAPWAEMFDGPAGRLLTTRVGIAGGIYGTLSGAYDLYQQGNPVDAFKRDGAAYVADVAGTAFSASTTAFLVAPNPVTGALAVGTGLVWAGAEVVDHWDDITEWSSDTWDSASHAVTSTVSSGVHAVEESFDDAKETLSDVADKGGDMIDGAKDFVGGLF